MGERREAFGVASLTSFAIGNKKSFRATYFETTVVIFDSVDSIPHLTSGV